MNSFGILQNIRIVYKGFEYRLIHAMVGKSRPHAAQMYRKTKRANDVGQLRENEMGFLYFKNNMQCLELKAYCAEIKINI